MEKVENEFIEHNQQSVENLFKLYDSLNFIYPEKKERLHPVLNIIKENWAKAILLNFPLFWVSTVIQNDKKIASTGTSWQYLNKGMMAQHLASNHPVGSRFIFLGMLNKVIENQNTGFVESYQVFYRPYNKFSSRIFEPLSVKVGKELSQILSYSYLELPFVKEYHLDEIAVSEIDNTYNPDFINFLLTERGEVFIKAQELNSDDLNLESLNSTFAFYGLQRKRRVFIAKSIPEGKIYGAIIINQSSLGLNFSFFENSSELILCKAKEEKFLLKVAGSLLQKASELLLPNFPLHYIPVLVDPVHAPILLKLQGKLIRNYNLFMILKGGYEAWYEYVEELTHTIFQRFLNNVYERSISN